MILMLVTTEAPPNILKFDRYSKHERPQHSIPALHASRVALGEIADESSRPPRRIIVADGHMDMFKSYREATKQSVGSLVATADSFNDEMEKNKLKIPMLTCPGLGLRKHPLISTPT